MNDEPCVRRLDIPSSTLAPAAARSALRELAAECTGADPDVNTLGLLVSEVVTNAVIHPEVPAGERIEVILTINSERTRVEVGDRGEGFEQAQPAVGGTSHNVGFGLMLLSNVSSRWGTVRGEGRFSVWFEVDHGTVTPLTTI